MRNSSNSIPVSKSIEDKSQQLVNELFSFAVELAETQNNELAKEIIGMAIKLGEAIQLGYPVFYLIGFSCELHLDNEDYSKANEYFYKGIQLINEAEDNYECDLNTMLDLKIRINYKL